MAKGRMLFGAGCVVATLMVANATSPGTSEKTGANASDTVAAIAPPVYSAASSALQIVGGLAQQALSALSQTVQQMPQQQPGTQDTLPPAVKP